MERSSIISFYIQHNFINSFVTQTRANEKRALFKQKSFSFFAPTAHRILTRIILLWLCWESSPKEIMVQVQLFYYHAKVQVQVIRVMFWIRLIIQLLFIIETEINNLNAKNKFSVARVCTKFSHINPLKYRFCGSNENPRNPIWLGFSHSLSNLIT